MTPPKENYWPAGGSSHVRQVTPAAMLFLAEHSRLLDFNSFFLRSQLGAVSTKSIQQMDEMQTLFLELQQHEELLTEVIICRVIDNFLSFVSDLLALIYKVRPEMLKSSEQERLDYILQFESMDELRTALAEKRVERLAYLGLKDLTEYLKTNMGFDLFPSVDQLNQAALLVEYRNLYVHNRGVVSQTSARRFPTLREILGKRIEVGEQDVRPHRQFIENSVFDIDIRAIKKFALPAYDIPPPPQDLAK